MALRTGKKKSVANRVEEKRLGVADLR